MQKIESKVDKHICDARGGSGLKGFPELSENRASLDTVASGPLDLSQLHNAEEERNAESLSSSLSDDHSEEEKDEGEGQVKRKGKLGNSSNSII